MIHYGIYNFDSWRASFKAISHFFNDFISLENLINLEKDYLEEQVLSMSSIKRQHQDWLALIFPFSNIVGALSRGRLLALSHLSTRKRMVFEKRHM